jgi:hypothetical protein
MAPSKHPSRLVDPAPDPGAPERRF